MKKSLIALAALAAVGAASAQSSVTLFGIVDATVQRVDNGDGAGAGSLWRLHHSGYNSSRLGFRGTEDLGGGMSASFWLELGMNNDTGEGQPTNVNNQTLPALTTATITGAAATTALPATGVRAGQQGFTFNRRSTVSLAGGWGEVRLGRDYTPQFWNLTIFDPFGTNGVGSTQTFSSIITGVTAVRASNSIGYFLPANLGGFYGQIQHYRGENPSTVVGDARDNGNGAGIRVGYAAGPLNVAAAIGRTRYSTGDARQANVGAQWDFGVAKLMGQITRDEVGATEATGYLIGGLVPVGAGEVRASFSQYEIDAVGAATEPRARKLALGYVHNLSKRTAVYTTLARVRNSNGSAVSVFPGAAGGPAANSSSSGLDLGVRHSF